MKWNDVAVCTFVASDILMQNIRSKNSADKVIFPDAGKIKRLFLKVISQPKRGGGFTLGNLSRTAMIDLFFARYSPPFGIAQAGGADKNTPPPAVLRAADALTPLRRCASVYFAAQHFDLLAVWHVHALYFAGSDKTVDWQGFRFFPCLFFGDEAESQKSFPFF